MTTGFGFCANCGTPATSAAEKFCASCGTALPAHAATAAAAAAAAPPPPPPPPPVGAPYAPPPYTPAQPAWGMPPAAAPAGSAVNPILLLVGALVIVAVIAGVGFYVVNNGSKGSPAPSIASSSPTVASSSPKATIAHSPSGGIVGGSGSIAFSPSTVVCGETWTTTVTLPASVKGTDQITLKVDGVVVGTQTVIDAGMTKQADGSWLGTDTGPADCSVGVGKHTEQLVDASGKVLAEGSFTFVESSTKTPAVSEGSITFKPAEFSCSAAPVQVTETIRLPASLQGADLITAVIDGQAGKTGTVASSFKKQSDGSWLATYTYSSTNFCAQYDTGPHVIFIVDQNGNYPAQGAWRIDP